MDKPDRIDDPVLQRIMDEAPPTPISVYLKMFFGINPGPVRVLGNTGGFQKEYPHLYDSLLKVLEDKEVLDQELCSALTKHFGFTDEGLLIRVQQSSHFDKEVKQ